MNYTAKTFIIAVVLVLITAIVILLVSKTQAPSEPIVTPPTNEQDNGSPQNPGSEEDVFNPISTYKDLLKVDMANEQTVTSPLTVTGEARGQWFFEASFPVRLENEQGVIATGIAQAKSDWMTTEFVPFSVTLNFPKMPSLSEGTIILEKQNASGLPENADEFQIPIKFE